MGNTEETTERQTFAEKIAEMEEKRTFNKDNIKALDKAARIMTNKVIKVIDYLISDTAETAAKNFQIKVLLPPPDYSLQPPSL